MPRPRRVTVTRAKERPKLSRTTLLSPLIGACLIVTFAYAASLLEAAPEVIAATALVFALLEGVVLAFVGAAWSPRGVRMSIALAVLTALLATPGRWGLGYLHAGGRTPPLLDLMEDLAVTIAWAAFAGIAGATVLRQRLAVLMPQRQRT